MMLVHLLSVLHSAPLCSAPICSALVRSAPLHSAPLFSSLLRYAPLCRFAPLCSTLLRSTVVSRAISTAVSSAVSKSFLWVSPSSCLTTFCTLLEVFSAFSSRLSSSSDCMVMQVGVLSGVSKGELFDCSLGDTFLFFFFCFPLPGYCLVYFFYLILFSK